VRHVAVVAGWRQLDGIDDLEINNAAGADQIVLDRFVHVGRQAIARTPHGWQVSTYCDASASWER
jgi:hypothetical protein